VATGDDQQKELTVTERPRHQETREKAVGHRSSKHPKGIQPGSGRGMWLAGDPMLHAGIREHTGPSGRLSEHCDSM